MLIWLKIITFLGSVELTTTSGLSTTHHKSY